MGGTMEYIIAACSGKKIEVKQGQTITVIDIDGGQVVDFWIYTMPLPTPLLVQGWFFHYSTAEKTSQTKLNLMYLESALKGRAAKPVEIIDTEIPTPDDAYMVVRRKLHR